jgi:citrate synthase
LLSILNLKQKEKNDTFCSIVMLIEKKVTMEKDKKRELSDIVVNYKGQLCEILELGETIFVHLFNSLREDYYAGVCFSFNPSFVTKDKNW